MTDSIPAAARDLLEASTAVLATVGPDGRPQLSAVWFLAEEGVIKVSLNSSRQKVKNLRANPAVTFFVFDPERPSRYLEVRGDAAIAEDPEYGFADRVGPKYGADLRSFDGPGQSRVVVTVVPVRVNVVDVTAAR